MLSSAQMLESPIKEAGATGHILRNIASGQMIALLVALIFCVAAPAAEPVSAQETKEVAELLVSDSAKGEARLAANRAGIIASLLERIEKGDRATQTQAAYELGIVISPWLRGEEAGRRHYVSGQFPTPRRPVERVPDMAESPAIRKCLQEAILKRIEGSPDDDLRLVLYDLCKPLNEVANDETMDWVMARIPPVEDGRLSPNKATRVKEYPSEGQKALIGLMENYLGIRPILPFRWSCGNTTTEGFKELHRLEAAELAEAKQELAACWKQVRPMSREKRIALTIDYWREYLAERREGRRGYYSRYSHGGGWLFQELSSLIRLGTPALKQLREQREQATGLEAKGLWETVIAAITGEENKELTRALFDGGGSQAWLACEVVVAAGSKKWLSSLEAVKNSQEIENSVSANQAIAICHGVEGISALKKALSRNPEDDTIKECLIELLARERKGPPRRENIFY